MVRGAIEDVAVLAAGSALKPRETQLVRFTPADDARSLRLAEAAPVVAATAWAQPNLYTLDLDVEVDGAVSDRQQTCASASSR